MTIVFTGSLQAVYPVVLSPRLTLGWDSDSGMRPGLSRRARPMLCPAHPGPASAHAQCHQHQEKIATKSLTKNFCV